ncbi:MAG: DNA cytosine methyltransferase [Candidatus Kryptoniota bacterium]
MIMPLILSHGSLFSGIGGFDLAAKWMGWKNIFQVEKDKWCRKVLAKNFPETKRFEDIKDFNGHEYHNRIDVISGGFPCQPFSVAGKRKGKDDNRYLWEEMLRVVTTIKPTYVVCENVIGIISLALDQVLSDLEANGYTTESFVIPACAKNAWHVRDRVWVVAYAKLSGFFERDQNERFSPNSYNIGCEEQRKSITEESEVTSTKCSNWWETEPELGRVVDGLPYRVDRLKGLGNSIVPQIAYEIFHAIDQIEQLYGQRVHSRIVHNKPG